MKLKLFTYWTFYNINITLYIILNVIVAREVFQKKRREHYNEFQTAKILAQQMMDEDEEDEYDDKQNNSCQV